MSTSEKKKTQQQNAIIKLTCKISLLIFNHIIYPWFQAAEKALKSVIITKQLQRSNSWFGMGRGNSNVYGHNLNDLATTIGDAYIKKIVSQLQNTLGCVSAMRYPDFHRYPRVPRHAFDQRKLDTAFQNTNLIINYASTINEHEH